VDSRLRLAFLDAIIFSYDLRGSIDLRASINNLPLEDHISSFRGAAMLRFVAVLEYVEDREVAATSTVEPV
jgi:hypothetical protein